MTIANGQLVSHSSKSTCIFPEDIGLQDRRKCQGFRKLTSDRHRVYRDTEKQTIMRSHFRSRDKDGGHINGSVILKNTMLHANLMALSFLEHKLWAIEVYIPNLTCIAWSYTHYELPTSRLSKVIEMISSFRPCSPGDATWWANAQREREFICHKITKKNIQNHTKYINSRRLPDR